MPIVTIIAGMGSSVSYAPSRHYKLYYAKSPFSDKLCGIISAELFNDKIEIEERFIGDCFFVDDKPSLVRETEARIKEHYLEQLEVDTTWRDDL